MYSGLGFPFSSVRSRSGLHEKALTSAVFFCTTIRAITVSSIPACVSTRERGQAVASGGCVVSTCILPPYFLCAAGLSSTLQALMAFDNG